MIKNLPKSQGTLEKRRDEEAVRLQEGYSAITKTDGVLEKLRLIQR